LTSIRNNYKSADKIDQMKPLFEPYCKRPGEAFTTEAGHGPVKERKARANRRMGRLVIDRSGRDAARVLSPCPSLAAAVFTSPPLLRKDTGFRLKSTAGMTKFRVPRLFMGLGVPEGHEGLR